VPNPIYLTAIVCLFEKSVNAFAPEETKICTKEAFTAIWNLLGENELINK
jgi:hypothetical protein